MYENEMADCEIFDISFQESYYSTEWSSIVQTMVKPGGPDTSHNNEIPFDFLIFVKSLYLYI